MSHQHEHGPRHDHGHNFNAKKRILFGALGLILRVVPCPADEVLSIVGTTFGGVQTDTQQTELAILPEEQLLERTVFVRGKKVTTRLREEYLL